MRFLLHWRDDFGINSVSYGIMCGALCGGYHSGRPGLIKIVSPFNAFQCLFWVRYGDVIVVGCCVAFTLCSGSGVYSDLRS